MKTVSVFFSFKFCVKDVDIMKKVWTDEKLSEYKKYREAGLSLIQIEKLMSITDRQARAAGEIIRKRERQAGLLDANEVSSEAQRITHQRNASGDMSSSRVLQIREGEDLSDDELLRLHGFDPEKFVLTSATSNFWGVTDSGHKLYQTKIKVQPVGLSIDEVIDAMQNSIRPLDVQVPSEVLANNDADGHSLVIPLFDCHFGITTIKTARPYLNDLISLIYSKRWKNIHVVIGGDYFHSDFMNKTQTASNTQLDHVNSVQALEDGTAFISALISACYQQAPSVNVDVIRGNHDADKEYVWSYGMKCKYADSPVAWNITTRSRNAFLMNQVGIMYSHGDKPRQSKLPSLFASEYADIWGASKYRMILVGHYHAEKVLDDKGVQMEQVATMKPTDGYEDENGFTMSRSKLEVFEFDDLHLLDTHYIEPNPKAPEHLLDGLLAY